ncbi:MAG: ankyrin repeat domain-containing protein [Candidatus Midichloria sp.]|nr:ankyrin repeat domain-containing protein [Candidatus Midichloria sp.]
MILLLSPEVLYKPLNEQGQTWLHLVLKENTKIVKFLLKHDIDDSVNLADKNLQTPLHYACIAGHKEIVKFTSRTKSCSRRILDIQGESPLHFTAFYGYAKVYNLF